MKILVAGCALTLCVLVSNVVVATAGEQPSRCESDLDCPGCQRCVEGICPGTEPSAICMCHEECTPVGFAWCDVSADKPLCGGECREGIPPSARLLTCGAGNDLPRVERVTMPATDKARVELSRDSVVVEEYSSLPDENDSRGLK